MSDNAACFGSNTLLQFMKKHKIDWQTVSAYEPMSNGRAERMVGTNKRGIGKIARNDRRRWNEAIPIWISTPPLMQRVVFL